MKNPKRIPRESLRHEECFRIGKFQMNCFCLSSPPPSSVFSNSAAENPVSGNLVSGILISRNEGNGSQMDPDLRELGERERDAGESVSSTFNNRILQESRRGISCGSSSQGTSKISKESQRISKNLKESLKISKESQRISKNLKESLKISKECRKNVKRMSKESQKISKNLKKSQRISQNLKRISKESQRISQNLKRISKESRKNLKRISKESQKNLKRTSKNLKKIFKMLNDAIPFKNPQKFPRISENPLRIPQKISRIP